jgi:N-acetyl-gamma-glutamyl-phosphate reductase
VAEEAGTRPHCVDISADFRYDTAEAYQAVYKHPHGAPERIRDFVCAVPEHLARSPRPHVAHPGCFATATLLASVPLLALGLTEPRLFVTGITGSTGAGRRPVEGTHHPQRHSDMYSYGALSHRHVPEITACARFATGIQGEFNFVPHSGPFARGIHVTVQASLVKPLASAEARAALADYYRHSPFVQVTDAAPRVKDVATSNYAHLSAVTNGSSIAVMSVLDNLNKGAAGGAVQWMNRLLGFDETLGLTAPAPGWT